MALISGTIPSLINGISQQPATLRLPTQGEIQENGLSHIARGLEKRPCTEHVAITGVTSNNSNDVFIHTIRRSEDEAYAIIVKGTDKTPEPSIKMIDLTGYATGTAGNEVYIRNNDITSSTFVTSPGTDQISTAPVVTNLLVGDQVTFSTTTTIPSGLSTSGTFYVKTVNSTTNFTVSATISNGVPGDIVDITGTGSGTHTVSFVNITQSNVLSSSSNTDVRNYLGNFVSTNPFEPNKLSATTIADFTFLLNKTVYVEQSSDDADDRDYEALIYFKIGDFGADYKVEIKEWNVDADGEPDMEVRASGHADGENPLQTLSATFTTPDNKTKSRSGDQNTESINNQSAVIVSNIANNLFAGPGVSTFTFTVVAATEVITTSADHGLTKDDTVTFTTAGTIPPGLAVDTTYYVLTTPLPTTLTVSLTKGGSVVDITDTGSGVHTLHRPFLTDLVILLKAGASVTDVAENDAYVATAGGDVLYSGSKGVIDHGTFTGTALNRLGSTHGTFTTKYVKGESIMHISNNKYPFTVEVTDGKGDAYMRAINGSDEVAQFGYLPGSGLPSPNADNFVAKISGDKSTGQDDYYVKWEGNVWKETIRPVYPGGKADSSGAHAHEIVKKNARTSFNKATMPVNLYKAFGTVDGVAGRIYYILSTVDWLSRTVGDLNTNPFPSFANYTVGGTDTVAPVDATDATYTINDVFFHRNRLGFVSDENVILSEAGEYFNFWHNTVLSVLDTAVIDVAVSNNQVAILKSAIPFQENLVLFSDLQQFKLTADAFLTPTSVTVDVATNFETSTDTKPVPAGKTIFFPFQRGSFSGIREYFIDIASETNDANEVTAHVPEYIEGTVKKMAVSSNEEVLLVLSDTNRRELIVYKYYYNDKEKLQSAWSKWKFDAEIIDVEFISSVAFILFRRGDGTDDPVYLEKLNLSVDSAIDVIDDQIGVRLDRRVKLSSGGISSLPYSDADYDKLTTTTVQISGSGQFGSNLKLKRLNTTGNFAPRIGQTFSASGVSGIKYKVIATEALASDDTCTIKVTPSVSKSDPWDDGKVLTFDEREVEYIVETGEKITASQLAGVLENGTQLSNSRGNSTPVVYAGVPYDFRYQFSQQFVKSNESSINSGRLQLRNFEISYDKTGAFTVEISPRPFDDLYRDVNIREFTGIIVGTSLLGKKELETGVFRVPVYCNSRDVKITVNSKSWYPLALQSADWEALQVLRSQRI